MTGRYSAIEAQGGDIGGFPTQRHAALSYDSGTAYSSDEQKPDATVKVQASPLSSTVTNLLSLPMALHIAVLAFYIALCAIWVTRVEQRVHVSLASASLIQTWINLISHLIMLAFSTAIIAVMQPIATRSPFGKLPQPLTSLSDKISSWNGLGSSLLNLYYNMRFPATLSNAVLTTLYLSTLSGLGISSSFLFSIPAVNNTIISNMTTRIGSPSLDRSIPPGSGVSGIPPDFTNFTFDWYRSGVGVGMLLDDNSAVYSGLSDNRIYDTLSPLMPSSNSTATVKYTDFNVKCGSVPQVSTNATSNSTFDVNIDAHDGLLSLKQLATRLIIEYPLGSDIMTLYDVMSVVADSGSNDIIRQLWPSADVLLRVPDRGTSYDPKLPARNLILYNIYNETGFVSRSQPIFDSENSTGSPRSLQVNLPDDSNSGGRNVSTGLLIQVIGCSMSTSTGMANIDATTNQLLDIPTSFRGASAHSTWADWKPDLTQSNALEDTWGSMFLPSLGSIGLWDGKANGQPLRWTCDDVKFNWSGSSDIGRETACHIPTVIEAYLTNRVFGAVGSRDENNVTTRDSSPSTPANATLGALESALASATAMTMWSAARANTLTVAYTPADNFLVAGELSTVVLGPVNGSTSVVERVLVGRLTFNVTSLIAGTSLSAILTALGAYILVKEDVARIADTPINDAGLLSIMTLDNSIIAARLSSFNMQTVQSRRRAGDFLVRVVDGRLVVVEDEDKDLEGAS